MRLKGILCVWAVLSCLLALSCGGSFAADTDVSDVLLRLGDDVRELDRLGQQMAAYHPAYADEYDLHIGLARKVERCALHLDSCRDILFLAAFADEIQQDAQERFVAQARLGLEKYMSMLEREQADLGHMLMSPDLEADPSVTRNVEDARSIVKNALNVLDSLKLPN